MLDKPEPVATSGQPTEERRPAVALGSLENYLGYHLRIAQAASFRAFQKRSGQGDLKPGWFAILSLIFDNPGIAPVILSKAAGRDKSTLTPILRELQREGLIAKGARANDRRSYGLRLTPVGRARLKALQAHAAEHDRVLDEIVGADKQIVLDALRRISDTFG